MNLIKNFLKSLIQYNFWIAVGAVCLCIASEKTYIGIHIRIFHPLHLFIFFSTLAEYNFHLLLYSYKKSKLKFNDINKISVFICVLSTLLAIYNLSFLSKQIQLIVAIAFVFTLVYSIPVLFNIVNKSKVLIEWVKFLLLAFVWSIVTVVLPGIYMGIDKNEMIVELCFRFLYLLPICMAFDIQHARLDVLKLTTVLPNKIGELASIKWMNMLVFLYFFVGCLIRVQYLTIHHFSFLFISAIIMYFTLRISVAKLKTEMFSFIIDSLLVVYMLLCFIK